MPDRPGVKEQTVTDEDITGLEEATAGSEDEGITDEDLKEVEGVFGVPDEDAFEQAQVEKEIREIVDEQPTTEVDGYRYYEGPAQLMIPTMTADAKVGLITSQVQQIEHLVGIMLGVLAVRKDDGSAPYDLWNKALEPAQDAEVLLKGVVQLLKTRNSRRY